MFVKDGRNIAATVSQRRQCLGKTTLATKKLSVPMSTHKVHVFCGYCERTHSTGISVNLDDGPSKKLSIADIFKDQALPVRIQRLLRNAILCRESGKSVVLRDRTKVFWFACHQGSHDNPSLPRVVFVYNRS